MAKREYPTLNAEGLAALKRFAEVEGKGWKDKLSMTYWYNARIWRDPKDYDGNAGYVLHSIRNTFGPSWLADFKFPPE